MLCIQLTAHLKEKKIQYTHNLSIFSCHLSSPSHNRVIATRIRSWIIQLLYVESHFPYCIIACFLGANFISIEISTHKNNLLVRGKWRLLTNKIHEIVEWFSFLKIIANIQYATTNLHTTILNYHITINQILRLDKSTTRRGAP